MIFFRHGSPLFSLIFISADYCYSYADAIYAAFSFFLSLPAFIISFSLRWLLMLPRCCHFDAAIDDGYVAWWFSLFHFSFSLIIFFHFHFLMLSPYAFDIDSCRLMMLYECQLTLRAAAIDYADAIFAMLIYASAYMMLSQHAAAMRLRRCCRFTPLTLPLVTSPYVDFAADWLFSIFSPHYFRFCFISFFMLFYLFSPLWCWYCRCRLRCRFRFRCLIIFFRCYYVSHIMLTLMITIIWYKALLLLIISIISLMPDYFWLMARPLLFSPFRFRCHFFHFFLTFRRRWYMPSHLLMPLRWWYFLFRHYLYCCRCRFDADWCFRFRFLIFSRCTRIQ